MKTANYRFPLLSFFFTAAFMPLFGQTYISGGSDVCLSTISRNPAGNYTVHYMKTGPYSGKILFGFTIFNNTTSSFTALPIVNYNVNDVSVVGNTIFICGEDSLSNGFYGVCKRGNGFFPPYYVRIYRLYNSNIDNITSVRRIRVFCDGADTNVLLIGNYLNKEQGFSKSAIVHIKNNSVCTVSYGMEEHFDDVDILDNFVVTVARKGRGGLLHEPHYMRVLKKSAFSLYDSLFNHYYSWSRRESTSRILLQKINGDSLVSVYQTDNHGFFFNTYTVSSNGTLQMYNYTKVAPSGNNVKVGDVSYNTSNRTLSIIHNSDTIGFMSCFDCTSFPALNYNNSYTVQFGLPFVSDKDTLLSLAPYLPNGFYATGVKNNKMIFWKTPNGCSDSVYFDAGTFNSRMGRGLEPTVKTTLGIHQVSFQVTTSRLQFEANCSPVNPTQGWLNNKE